MIGRAALALLLALGPAAAPAPAELRQADAAARHAAQAARVTIIRDRWGIAHVEGETDADAVFGMIYAQAEDDFARIERNYLVALGRTAEADGESAIWHDLRQRLYVDEADLRARHAAAPAWLQRLTNAWADGLNHYLATHPDVRPLVLTRFEPWMALSFSEGSIGGDIERIDPADLRAFYEGRDAAARPPAAPVSTGSNGIAIAPRLTADGRALLLINPHTTHYFRSELQMRSGQGLNAYGAVTWGQFFIYQGFNDSAGWMHTSSRADAVDEFLETIVTRGDRHFYRYGAELRPVTTRPVAIAYRTAGGGRAVRRFTVMATHRGPIVRAQDGKWVSVAMMFRPVAALEQSFLRTKAADLDAFLKVGERQANSSNNTIFADRRGNIAFLMPQFLPRRDDRFDYSAPVDGSDPATDWQGLHRLAETPSVINPPSGWVMNTNNWPYSAAGPAADTPPAFPRYMDMFGENQRGVHALRLLDGSSGWTRERLEAAAFDPAQPGFERLVPGLVQAWDRLPPADPHRTALADPIAVLRGWDHRWSAESVAQTLATFWAEALIAAAAPAPSRPSLALFDHLVARTDAEKLAALAAASARIAGDFGTWRTPWGAVNRLQRPLPGAAPSDARPSHPVAYASQLFGSLAAFEARPGDTRRRYGTSGNSFVAVVAFGAGAPAASAISTGGASGDPASPHFNDQSALFAAGRLRPVWFTPAALAPNAVRRYHPGLAAPGARPAP
jgi:acyl-homoserine-lactone acylase